MSKKSSVLGYKIDLLGLNESVDLAFSRLYNGENTHVVTINPELIEHANNDEQLRNVIKNADITIPDGVGIIFALKMKSIKQEKVPGIDFAYNLLKKGAKNGLKVALIGASEDIVEKAVKSLKDKIPNLNITYYHHGFYDKNAEENIINSVKNSKPQIVLAALGGKKQELLISRLKKEIEPSCIFVGVGGSFDVWSGKIKRAPYIIQRLGLEWLYRVILEPKRLKRIFPTLPIFLFRVFLDSINEE